jgi:hypothetical protein
MHACTPVVASPKKSIFEGYVSQLLTSKGSMRGIIHTLQLHTDFVTLQSGINQYEISASQSPTS